MIKFPLRIEYRFETDIGEQNQDGITVYDSNLNDVVTTTDMEEARRLKAWVVQSNLMASHLGQLLPSYHDRPRWKGET